MFETDNVSCRMLPNHEIVNILKTGQNLDFIQKPMEIPKKTGSVIKVMIKENAWL